MAFPISSSHVPLTALVRLWIWRSLLSSHCRRSFLPLHVVQMPPSSPMVVSRERKDRSSFWPEPRIVQMLVEQLRHHHIVALFVIRIHFDWTVVDKTGTFLQAILRAVCSHVRKATLSK
ncbi:hypothetical protein SMACR_12106 [Sordaria macrospora]|uniref:WGS project CABT00000000 data, contig 2.13 n=2 Tax=Sordaria macrospora TaxID=5147 RepID=F7VYD0_SORMK|nr:uncharacterized protein SMAC_12106 [Sordaria macrospora k-hell]KAA8628957.1 hypothetical protein SMACR_12106 [Sordaria macrospora]WPJ62965.1 hypothetical protein SMAC4_12106 [Sordaria macrospora]CCC10524.1 unnamed protein product [Sordaria macrospora k-hell]